MYNDFYILLTILHLVQRYATISSDGQHIVTTGLFDREREEHINLLLVCNITMLMNGSSNFNTNGKDPIIISTDIHSSNDSRHSVPRFVSRFRKQVKIQVVDR